MVLAVRTAMDAAVKHATDADITGRDAAGTTFIDAALVMSVLKTRKKHTLSLITGPVEEMLVVGQGCGVVSFVKVVRAMYLHGQAAAEAGAAAATETAAAAAAAATATAATATAADASACSSSSRFQYHFTWKYTQSLST